ncbi:hypothetical protein WME73_47065 [Sorangium sp. So ce302]|uniref:hypothetical protein n=1 Tax=unclassified Sorangium TaxID=2621164 RepID=UPI003F632A1F
MSDSREYGKFQVYAIKTTANGAHVTGRLIAGTFTRGKSVHSAHHADEMGVKQGEPVELDLLIDGIVIYSNEIDEIQEGLTALIRFQGHWPGQISQGWILEGG